jgi:signal transduction histidine kinase
MNEPFAMLGGLAGGVLPVAFSMAVVVAGERLRQGRRRRTLNQRLHELRRPLQVLALAAKAPGSEGPDPLELALAALRDLDREVNGGSSELKRRPVEARMLAISACERWRVQAARAGRRIAVRWPCGDAVADVDPLRVSQALDNLIANSLEHGDGPITLEGRRHGDRIELAVRDTGGNRLERCREHTDPRRGHGLHLTRRLARENGGELRIRGGRAGTVAALVLPLVPGRLDRLGFPHRR